MKSNQKQIGGLVILAMVGVLFLAGCGGSTASPANNQPPPLAAVTVSPASVTVQASGVQQFTATVSPSGASQAVSWSLSGAGCTGASCGTIDATGKYTAPATVSNPATVTVTARSVVGTSSAATATVTILNVPSSSFSVNPASVAFGNQTLNTTSAPRTVTLTNTGSATEPVSVRMNGFNFADFAQANDCPPVIAPGASCSFRVTFTPSATGDRIGVLVIDGSRDEEGLVNLTGTGIARTTGLPGTFTMVSSMSTARADHTATLLPNGKVLIAGGNGNGFQPLASAELYDPSTGMFTLTGSMSTARADHTATLLPNGKVLIAGGSDRRDIFQPLAGAELYDPSTGMFTTTGSMTTVQRAGPATSLQDGRVFVAGETNAEIYDPASGTFAPTGAYVDAIPVWWNTVSLLVDGRILLTGCAVQCAVGATELFDPQSGTFSRTAPMKGWDNVNTATLLMNGRVLLVGNVENDGSPADAEVYDPAAGTFMFIGNTIAPHEFAAAVGLVDGSVLITGGQLPGGNGSAGSDLYLPASGTFAFAGNMTAARHEQTATLLDDGTVLIVGGYSVWPTPTASAEIYKPAPSAPQAALARN
jgi:hypothetical protein